MMTRLRSNVTFELSLCRHKKNREAAVELLMRLKDNRDLQKFLQDCQEVQIHILFGPKMTFRQKNVHLHSTELIPRHF